MQVPDVRYARSGDLRIAYQSWGEGPPMLNIADLISHVEIAWEHELYRRSLEHMGRHMTCAGSTSGASACRIASTRPRPSSNATRTSSP